MRISDWSSDVRSSDLTKGLPAVGWVLGWVLAFTAIGVAARAVTSQQRRFAQAALGKYLPRDIAAQILAEPEKLALHGEKRQIFTLFTDLEENGRAQVELQSLMRTSYDVFCLKKK